MRNILLTRTSHQNSAATLDRPAPASLCSLAVLDVVQGYACVRLGRLPRNREPLRRLASTLGEKSGFIKVIMIISCLCLPPGGTELYCQAAERPAAAESSPSPGATIPVPEGDVAALIAAINTANGNGQADTIALGGGTYSFTAPDNF